MKRFVALLLTAVMVVSLCVPTFACAENNSFDAEKETIEFNNALYAVRTGESAMPKLTDSVQACAVSVGTLESASRTEWAASTARVLEDAYRQDVKSVIETENAIVFQFDVPSEVDAGAMYVDKVEYIKPESTRASSYNRKLTYMYGWAAGYYELESKSELWEDIFEDLITVAGYSNPVSVSDFAFEILMLPARSLTKTTPVRTSTMYQRYLLNKVGQIQDPATGIWGPYAYVGSYKDFYRTLLEKNDYENHYVTLGYEENVPENLVCPMNPDRHDEKPHYYESDWILNKAEDVFENGTTAYRNVYGWATQFSSVHPGDL